MANLLFVKKTLRFSLTPEMSQKDLLHDSLVLDRNGPAVDVVALLFLLFHECLSPFRIGERQDLDGKKILLLRNFRFFDRRFLCDFRALPGLLALLGHRRLGFLRLGGRNGLGNFRGTRRFGRNGGRRRRGRFRFGRGGLFLDGSRDFFRRSRFRRPPSGEGRSFPALTA